MKALRTEIDSLRENFVAELADAALEEATRHGVRGTSIEQELGYWKALVPVVAGCVEEMRTGASVDCNRGEPEDFLASLAEAAYEVSLNFGFRDSFLELQIGLWKSFRRVVRRSRRARIFFRYLCSRAKAGIWSDRPQLRRGYALS